MAAVGHSFDVRTMQMHDGPGIRTTVFMKGCSLRCKWCHNPESLSTKQEVWRRPERCIGCEQCVEACPEGAIHFEDGIRVDQDKCTGCASCVEVCPSKSTEAIRTDWSVKELFETVNRDRAFLMNGGGVTVSGGEPALQWRFVSELLQTCQEEKLHTALDTCGAVAPRAFDALLPGCDLILFDLKIMDPEIHKQWTGQTNLQILENLRTVASHIRSGSTTKLWIRTPLIPGATASERNIEAIGNFIREDLNDAVERWELCSFNNLCADKYHRLGNDWSMEDVPLLSRAEGETLLSVARSSCGLSEGSVFLKGRMS